MVAGCIMYEDVQKDQRDQRIVEHLSLVKRLAYHLASRLPASVQIDDLTQAGMIGLIEAARQFDPTQGASFETYASIRIRGAMLDEVRHADWSPRSLHKKMRQLSEAMRQIENETGRDARDEDVARRMDISIDDYHQILRDSATARMFSIDQAEEAEHPFHLSTEDRDPLAELHERGFQTSLAQCIDQLPDRERLLMSLYYNEELNLKEIGQVMDVSESRVCQLHGQALARIRGKMTEWTG